MQVKQKMHKQPIPVSRDIQSTKVYGKHTNERQKATIYTDRQIALDSLKNGDIHTFLVEEIRKKLTELKKINWKIKLRWVKTQIRIGETR